MSGKRHIKQRSIAAVISGAKCTCLPVSCHIVQTARTSPAQDGQADAVAKQHGSMSASQNNQVMCWAEQLDEGLALTCAVTNPVDI